MSEVLRELVVALSLDSDNFSSNMRTINHQIKEAESTFRLAGAGIDKFEKSVKGTEAKLSMLGEKLAQQNRAVEQYSRALSAAFIFSCRALAFVSFCFAAISARDYRSTARFCSARFSPSLE